MADSDSLDRTIPFDFSLPSSECWMLIKLLNPALLQAKRNRFDINRNLWSFGVSSRTALYCFVYFTVPSATAPPPLTLQLFLEIPELFPEKCSRHTFLIRLLHRPGPLLGPWSICVVILKFWYSWFFGRSRLHRNSGISRNNCNVNCTGAGVEGVVSNKKQYSVVLKLTLNAEKLLFCSICGV